jgi:hypothetical protein
VHTKPDAMEEESESPMDELIKLLTQKVGITEKQAAQAVETVIGYLKGQLPAPLASQIDGILGGAGKAQDLGSLAKGMGGLLGKK